MIPPYLQQLWLLHLTLNPNIDIDMTDSLTTQALKKKEK